MISLPQSALTFLGVLSYIGDVAALGLLLTWQEWAPSSDLRCPRLIRGVLPATAVLLGLLLLVFKQLMSAVVAALAAASRCHSPMISPWHGCPKREIASAPCSLRDGATRHRINVVEQL